MILLGTFSFMAVVAVADALVNSALTQSDIQTIARGGVAVIPAFLPNDLVTAMRADARNLFETGSFQPDGLTNTALSKTEQGFTGKADRQTFCGGANWLSDLGDYGSRLEFRNKMYKIKDQLALELNRPSLKIEGERRHEITYNWYEPGAKLGRHLDEHHEETKGVKGWLLDSRRSVTWLLYLNDGWKEEEGGALRCFPRSNLSSQQVGCHERNLQVGWLHVDGEHPVFLDCFRSSGQSALYTVKDSSRQVLSLKDFDVPRQPIDFATFLPSEFGERFEQISTARLDPRFAAVNDNGGKGQASLLADRDEAHSMDISPESGTLVIFDSVSLPHLVREVTGSRQRIAATGWFHEDNTFLV